MTVPKMFSLLLIQMLVLIIDDPSIITVLAGVPAVTGRSASQCVKATMYREDTYKESISVRINIYV